MTTETPDFLDQYRRFERLPPGAKAPMRRVTEPDELRDTPGLYRLFPGASPTAQELRAAFILPWCQKASGAIKLGPALADRISEARVIQIARAEYPSDLIALRRLVIQLQPTVGWLEVAALAWFWGGLTKREMVEAYFICLHKLEKGANR